MPTRLGEFFFFSFLPRLGPENHMHREEKSSRAISSDAD